MAIEAPPPVARPLPPLPVAAAPEGEGRVFARRAALFLLIGLVLYGGLYAVSEWLIHQHAQRNRFYMVQSAPHERYDFVILGASHAAVFDYRDMNARLEEMTGARVMNLSTVGAGVTVNGFLLDYFFRKREADAVVYVLDSFAFYSPAWNEERLQDTELYLRAPWDPQLAGLLLREPATRMVALDYVSGFSKINNPNRFEPDIAAAEGATFDRTYRPIPQIDRQRIEFLYPASGEGRLAAAAPYFAQLEEMIRDVRSRGARFVVIRPPIPERFHSMLPAEEEFDQALLPLLTRNGVEYHDFTHVNNDPSYFYDSDHLNQAGVLSFFENHLAPLLRPARAVMGEALGLRPALRGAGAGEP
jgi:hypothetical protein